MTCADCGLELSPGSAHFNLESCVAALRHALEISALCLDCGGPVEAVFHPGCMPRAAAKGAAGHGANILERKVVGFVNELLRPPEEGEGEDAPTPKRGTRRFTP